VSQPARGVKIIISEQLGVRHPHVYGLACS
jgi:hypothetical protein